MTSPAEQLARAFADVSAYAIIATGGTYCGKLIIRHTNARTHAYLAIAGEETVRGSTAEPCDAVALAVDKAAGEAAEQGQGDPINPDAPSRRIIRALTRHARDDERQDPWRDRLTASGLSLFAIL